MINQEKTLELVDRSQRKDTAAFAQLVTEFQPMVFRLALLRDVEELEVIEVQTITGLSPETIKSTLYLARKNIRNKMNQIDPDL